MNRLAAWIGVLAVVALITAVTAEQGFRDLVRSATTFAYPEIRDMRRTVAIPPNKVMTREPDPASVPTSGIERTYGLQGIELADKLAETMVDPTVVTDSSIVRGERKYQRLCTPCHGPNLAGNGPVAALFMPPPDLLAEPTRQRKDGYIYSYIRHGGAVMPSYGAQTTPEECWELVHYIRHMQRTSPR
jgi:mono/diheme cytochrome c family protein